MNYIEVTARIFGEDIKYTKYTFNTVHIMAVMEASDGTASIKLTNGDIYPTTEKYVDVVRMLQLLRG
jgi:hypothetical protein